MTLSNQYSRDLYDINLRLEQLDQQMKAQASYSSAFFFTKESQPKTSTNDEDLTDASDRDLSSESSFEEVLPGMNMSYSIPLFKNAAKILSEFSRSELSAEEFLEKNYYAKKPVFEKGLHCLSRKISKPSQWETKYTTMTKIQKNNRK